MSNLRLNKGIRHWILVGMVMLALCTVAQAGGVGPLNDKKLIVSSRAIIRGEVIDIESQLNDNDGNIYTYIKVRISEVLKSDITAEEIVLRQRGGHVGEQVEVVRNVPVFVLSEKVLLYLNTSDDGALEVAGSFNGKLTIIPDSATDKQFVQRLSSIGKGKGEPFDKMELTEYQSKIFETLAANAERVAEFARLNENRPLLLVPKEFSTNSTNKNNKKGPIPAFGCLPPPTPFYPTPSGVVITDPMPTFSWSSVPGASSYTLYILRASDGARVVQAFTTSTSYKPSTALPTNTLLYWKVKGTNSSCEGDYSTIIYFTVSASCLGNPNPLDFPPFYWTLPNSPSNPIHIREAEPTFKWTSVPGATGYTLYVQRYSDREVLVRAPGILTTSVKVVRYNLPPSTLMYWKVKGTTSNCQGPYSNPVYFVIDPVIVLP